MITLGLTGGIAAGKSTVARELERLGAHVIDADRLGHSAYEPGTRAHRDVIAAFGPEIVAADGRIGRAALAARVFGKPDQLRRLTDIVWPEIRRLAEVELAALPEQQPGAVAVLDAAVLLEAGWEDLADEVWVVLLDRATAVRRAVARGGISAAAVEARIDAQLSNDARAARADVVIDNSGDEAALRTQIDAHWRRLRATAPSRARA